MCGPYLLPDSKKNGNKKIYGLHETEISTLANEHLMLLLNRYHFFYMHDVL